jgi:GDP-L-fucose synthase
MDHIEAKDIYDNRISHINCGSEDEISITELANLIKQVVEFSGKIVFDPTKPDGTFRKKMDNTRISSTGFNPSTSLKEGIEKTYNWFVKNRKEDC